MRRLLGLTQGDQVAAERLIRAEVAHAPGANRAEWIRRAIEHLERDSR